MSPHRACTARVSTALARQALLFGAWLGAPLGAQAGAPAPADPPTVAQVAAAAPLHANGIGPLILGARLTEAARRTLPLDRAAAQIGPGCDDRDQVSVVLRVEGHALTVMAMAGADGRIDEILALPVEGARRLDSAEACQAHGERFAQALSHRLGAATAQAMERKPVSDEFRFRFEGGAHVVARWFAGGQSCDLLLQFGGRGKGAGQASPPRS